MAAKWDIRMGEVEERLRVVFGGTWGWRIGIGGFWAFFGVFWVLFGGLVDGSNAVIEVSIRKKSDLERSGQKWNKRELGVL